MLYVSQALSGHFNATCRWIDDQKLAQVRQVVLRSAASVHAEREVVAGGVDEPAIGDDDQASPAVERAFLRLQCQEWSSRGGPGGSRATTSIGTDAPKSV